MTRHRFVFFAALALFALSVAAQSVLHPHTPYRLFLVRAMPAAALWLTIVVGLVRNPAMRRYAIALAVTAAASFALAAGILLRLTPPPFSLNKTALVMMGVWLTLLLLLAIVTGRLKGWFRHGPMTVLGAALIIYALASGFVALPFGAVAMTVGVLWLAAWQGCYLYHLRGV